MTALKNGYFSTIGSQMRVETTGIVFYGKCTIRTAICTATEQGAITAVWEIPSRQQINVCSSCLSEMIRMGNWIVPGAEFRSRADIVVKNRQGQIVVVAEVKNNEELNGSLAAERTYADLLQRHSIPRSDYFLLVAPKKSFLWINKDQNRIAYSPAYVIDTKDIFHLDESSESDFLGSKSTENLKRHLIYQYFNKLKATDWIGSNAQVDDWLIESGLIDEIKSGTIQEDFAGK